MRVALALALVAAAVAAPAAPAKEGAQAHLLTRLPRHAIAGTAITVRWTVDVPGANGQRAPFGAIGMFVRLVGRSGASTSATAAQGQPPYKVRIRVPRGGIRAIRFGLHGTSDIFFPLK
jgi:hypothetical protein